MDQIAPFIYRGISLDNGMVPFTLYNPEFYQKNRITISKNTLNTGYIKPSFELIDAELNKHESKNIRFMTNTINGRCVFVDNDGKEHLPDFITMIKIPSNTTKLYVGDYNMLFGNLNNLVVFDCPCAVKDIRVYEDDKLIDFEYETLSIRKKTAIKN